MTLLDPTYAKKYIPIIASVSEHQPTAWTSFFFDLHVMVPFAPVGLYFLFQRLNDNGDAKIFLILYGTISWYFAGVMVRLMLTLAPIACILGAIGISGVLNAFCAHLKKSWGAVKAALTGEDDEADKSDDAAKSSGAILPAVISMVVTVTLGFLTIWYAMHASFVASEAYSSPSIVLGTLCELCTAFLPCFSCVCFRLRACSYVTCRWFSCYYGRFPRSVLLAAPQHAP